jgi:20S proteasome subunit beta 7
LLKKCSLVLLLFRYNIQFKDIEDSETETKGFVFKLHSHIHFNPLCLIKYKYNFTFILSYVLHQFPLNCELLLLLLAVVVVVVVIVVAVVVLLLLMLVVILVVMVVLVVVVVIVAVVVVLVVIRLNVGEYKRPENQYNSSPELQVISCNEDHENKNIPSTNSSAKRLVLWCGVSSLNLSDGFRSPPPRPPTTYQSHSWAISLK